MDASDIAASAKRKAYMNIVLPLFITSVIAYIDRVNIGYAALTMNKDLGFTAEMLAWEREFSLPAISCSNTGGADRREIQSPHLAGADHDHLGGDFRADGVHAYGLAVLPDPLPLGAAEASLYPVIYATCIPRFFGAKDRARAIALLLTSLQTSAIIGGPLAGWFSDSRCWG